jgi:hypothetical protein
VPTTISYKYRLRFDVANLVGTWTIKSYDGTQTIGTVSANGLQQAFEWVATTTGGLRLVAVSNLASGDFDNFTLTKLGATLALEPEGIQTNKWYDSSTNLLNAIYPATGSSLIRNPNTPMIVGGSSTTSDLSLKTTTAAGTTGADMHFLVGNNGATEAMTILNSGNVGIGTTAPATKLDVAGSMQVSSTVALSLGGYVRTFAEATGTPAGTSTAFNIAVDVPATAKLLGCQLRVDTAFTAGETWSAAYYNAGGFGVTITATGQAVAQNTKVNIMHLDMITATTGDIKVRITRDAGNFTNGVGVMRAIVYYEMFTAMGNAA